MPKDKVKDKATAEGPGFEVKVTHEADGPWHALVKLADDGQRKKNLNFVEETADELLADIDAAVTGLREAQAAVQRLVSEQAVVEDPTLFQ